VWRYHQAVGCGCTDLNGPGSEQPYKPWIPRANRGAVHKELKDDARNLFEQLSLNYDDATLRTIEQIDAFWL